MNILRNVGLVAACAILSFSTAALARQAGPNTTVSIHKNGDGTATRTRVFTAPKTGTDYTRTATRGGGTATITYNNGATRTHTRGSK